MSHSLIINKSEYDSLMHYFNKYPFIMQAAFLLTDISNENDNEWRISIHDIKTFSETDYEYCTTSSLSFSAQSFLNILKVASKRGNSLIYIHSHQSNRAGMNCWENNDHKAILRICYGYIPFGIHASLEFIDNKITGRVWSPSLSIEPLAIVYHD